MATWRQQALIEAPVEEVWELIADPARFPEWNESVEVTGLPTRIEKGSTFRRRAPSPLGPRMTTTFEVEELDEDLRELRLRCQTSGLYSRWMLTEARGNTFADVEIGSEPRRLGERVVALSHTKGYLRGTVEGSIDGLCRALSRGRKPPPA